MTVTSYYGPDPGNHPDQKELSNIFRNLKSSPEAAFVLGCNGLDRGTFDPRMEDMYRGVDGTKVPQEQCWKPDASLLPPPFSAEEKAAIKKDNEEHKDIIQENIRKMESGELKPCGVVVRSDYDIL
ncbi:hypothetical protein RU639_002542 [Aspergillus parasiticus]